MVDFFEVLVIAAIGGTVTLVLREFFSWKFPQLEKQIKKKEKLLERVYGPIRVLTWRLKNEMDDGFYVLFEHEHVEVRRIYHQYNYEMDSRYGGLLKYYLEHGNAALNAGWSQGKIRTADPNQIKSLIDLTEKKHKELVFDLKNLNDLRSGIYNNLYFFFRVWNFEKELEKRKKEKRRDK